MTAIYDRLNAKGYEIINCVNGYDDSQKLRSFDGSSRKETWQPIFVRRDRISKRGAFKGAELPYDHDSFILRRCAIDALRDILDAHGELLPLATERMGLSCTSSTHAI